MAVTDRERARRGGCIRIDAWYPAVSARSGQAVDEPDEQVGIAADVFWHGANEVSVGLFLAPEFRDELRLTVFRTLVTLAKRGVTAVVTVGLKDEFSHLSFLTRTM